MGSLQVRLILTYLATILVTLGLAALSLFLLIGDYRDGISYSNLEDISRLIDSQANAEIKSAITRRETPPQGAALLLALRTALSGGNQQDPEPTSVAIADRNGMILPGFSASPSTLDGARVDTLPPESDTTREPHRCRLKVAGENDLLCVAIPLSDTLLTAFPQDEAYALIVAEPAASLGEVFGALVPRLAFSGIIGIAAAVIFGFILSQSVAAPLRNISRAARNVARGNYRQRVPATGPTEVRDLAATFNRMTEQVQRSQQTLRDFLANISHELKTPLTSIHGFSEAVLDGTIDDPDGIHRSARIISDESTRVLRLVEELLDLSRIESGQVPMRLEEFSVGELLQHVGDVFALRSEESGVALEVDGASPVRIHGDFDRLEQVLNNLMDNAFRHTASGGNVRVSATQTPSGYVQISITDTGKGIPLEELPFLFDRFYRAQGSAGKGYGLGLAIAKEIVRAHGGDIWAASKQGEGTSFHFTLPVARAVVRARG
jgi:signal transduction histidine kinase